MLELRTSGLPAYLPPSELPPSELPPSDPLSPPVPYGCPYALFPYRYAFEYELAALPMLLAPNAPARPVPIAVAVAPVVGARLWLRLRVMSGPALVRPR
jgi:hypothetical protein